MLRPDIRIPIWAAAGVPAAAYVLRSMLRGWDFRPDLPQDALVTVLLIALIAVASWNRSASRTHERSDHLAAEMNREDDTESHKG